jgi:hypothetical protein
VHGRPAQRAVGTRGRAVQRVRRPPNWAGLARAPSARPPRRTSRAPHAARIGREPIATRGARSRLRACEAARGAVHAQIEAGVCVGSRLALRALGPHRVRDVARRARHARHAVARVGARGALQALHGAAPPRHAAPRRLTARARHARSTRGGHPAGAAGRAARPLRCERALERRAGAAGGGAAGAGARALGGACRGAAALLAPHAGAELDGRSG